MDKPRNDRETRDSKGEGIRPEKQEDKLMHRSGKRRRRKRKRSNLCAGRKVPCWSRGRRRLWAPPGTTPWVQVQPSRPASWRGCGNGRGVSGWGDEERERSGGGARGGVRRRGRERWEMELKLSYINRRGEMCGDKTRWESERPMDATATGRCSPAAHSPWGFLYACSVSCVWGVSAGGVVVWIVDK